MRSSINPAVAASRKVNLVGANAANAVYFLKYSNASPKVINLTNDFKAEWGIKFQLIRWGGTLLNYVHNTGYGYGTVGAEVASASSAVQQVYANDQSSMDPNYLPYMVSSSKYLGFRVLIVANMYTGTLSELHEVIDSYEASNVPIAGIELGNEGYLNRYNNLYPTVTDYINQCSTWVADIRANYPNYKIGIVIAPNDAMKDSNQLGTTNVRLGLWNTAVTGSGLGDAYVLHSYSNNTGSASHIAALTGYVRSLDKPVWLTEFNLGEPDISNYLDQITHVRAMLTYIRTEPRIKMATIHNLVASGMYGYNMMISSGGATDYSAFGNGVVGL